MNIKIFINFTYIQIFDFCRRLQINYFGSWKPLSHKDYTLNCKSKLLNFTRNILNCISNKVNCTVQYLNGTVYFPNFKFYTSNFTGESIKYLGDILKSPGNKINRKGNTVNCINNNITDTGSDIIHNANIPNCKVTFIKNTGMKSNFTVYFYKGTAVNENFTGISLNNFGNFQNRTENIDTDFCSSMKSISIKISCYGIYLAMANIFKTDPNNSSRAPPFT